MKKIILLLLFTAVSMSYANPLAVRFLTKAVEIISPDGEHKKYYSTEKIPKLLYASQIIAHGMAILNYYGVDIVLKNNQGLFIAKNPITKTLEFSKVENSTKGPISISFDTITTGEVSADGEISLKYDKKENCIIMEVINGNVSMQANESTFELLRGETFKHKFRGKNYAI